MADLYNFTALTSNFSIPEFVETITPVFMYIIGMVIYAIFIFKFYHFVARKDVFKMNLKDHIHGEDFFSVLLSKIVHLIEYIFIFPAFVIFWFIVLSIIFVFISKQQDLQNILIIAIALVAVIRICAYYNEDLSKDLAKMLPFAILAVFLIDQSYFALDISLEMVKTIPSLWKQILYYLVAVIILEFILRIVYSIIGLIVKGKED